jgi:hypothetical protein
MVTRKEVASSKALMLDASEELTKYHKVKILPDVKHQRVMQNSEVEIKVFPRVQHQSRQLS